MSKETDAKKSQAGRCMVEVEPKTAKDFESIRKDLGNPKKITLATAALKYITARVKSGELALVNSELKAA